MKSCLAEEEDSCVRSFSSQGKFTSKYAWNMCRDKHCTSLLSQMVWQRMVPIKWAFVSWRAVRKKVPLDCCLQKKGIQLAPRCSCCKTPTLETVDHVLLNSSTAQEKFGNLCWICIVLLVLSSPGCVNGGL